MFNFGTNYAEAIKSKHNSTPAMKHGKVFLASKRLFDIAFSLMLVVPICIIMAILVALNPFLNKGRLFYSQTRMGKDCKAFKVFKFRTMIDTDKISRGADDPLETDRITKLGAILRKTRIDELPQILNVLRGDMSLIGPRPDYFSHARRYISTIPEYRARHSVRPGISGLAQTQLGYVQGVDATTAKVRADLFYISNAGFRMEMWIFWQTLVTVFGRKGA